MIRGSFFILLFYLLGEIISLLLDGFIPGSVVGMVLLFCGLQLKIIRPEWVKSTATVITKNMAVFFVPAAVGIIAYIELLSNSFVTVFSAIIISTILTIIVVGLVQQTLENKIKSKRK